MAHDLKLGDRVRINATCDYQELIGTELFICELRMRQDLSIITITSEQWPPRNYGRDEWDDQSMLDKIGENLCG